MSMNKKDDDSNIDMEKGHSPHVDTLLPGDSDVVNLTPEEQLAKTRKGTIAMGVNIIGALLIIPFAKTLFGKAHEGLPFVLCVSILHFICTWIACAALIKYELVKYKDVPRRDIAPVALVGLVSIVCLQLSLTKNSLGVYQLAKMATVPTTVAMSWAIFGKTFSKETLGSLAMMTTGIGVAVGQRVELDVVGMTYAGVGVVSASLGAILQGNVQRKHEVDPSVLTYHMMFFSVPMLMCVAAYFEDVMSIPSYEFSNRALFLIVVTCLIAIALNISGIWILGAFSAVTYSVVGYLKTSAVLLTGILFFGDEVNLSIGIGVALVFVGSYFYQKSKA